MKKSTLLFSIFIILIISIYFFTPQYVFKALLYQKPDISDYTIFYNRPVNKGIAQPWAVSKEIKNIDKKTLNAFETYETTAYIVIQNDTIIYESYWDSYTDSTLSGSFSASKSIVAMLAGIALGEGKIKSINQSIVEYLPEMNHSGNEKIKIIDLLTMSSGLNWDEEYASLFSPTTEAYYGNNLRDQMLELNCTEKPGTRFSYISANTQLLAMIIERACGKSISEYASEKIWQPVGAEHPALWCLDNNNGIEKAYCCFNASARDFARFGSLMLHYGKWKDTEIIPEYYMKKALSPASYLKDQSGYEVQYYGYQFWIMKYKGLHIPYARGILGQYIFSIPEKNAIVVRLGHKRSDTKENEHPIDTKIYLDAALKLLK